MGKIRGTHTSPGIYTKFTDISYAAKSLGITSLGLVGETLKGRAFDPVKVSDWAEFTENFGGTSAEKFKDTQYPKYELPYIAKSYLRASDSLYVCRVLGLSGYNAGPAFLLTASGEDGIKYLVAVLRSRGHYEKYSRVGDACDGYDKYDELVFDCDEVQIEPYTTLSTMINCGNYTGSTSKDDEIEINSLNLGQFTIVALKDGEVVGRYPVSLNAGTKNYIYNVIGEKPSDGTAAVYVEELYDLFLYDLIANNKVDHIEYASGSSVDSVSELNYAYAFKALDGPVHIPYLEVGKKQLGMSFLYDGTSIDEEDAKFAAYPEDGDEFDTLPIPDATKIEPMEIGSIYQIKKASNGAYVYAKALNKEIESGETKYYSAKITSIVESGKTRAADVAVYKDNFEVLYYLSDENEVKSLTIGQNMSDYREAFKCSSTPWFVSEAKSTGEYVEVKKLFRFHTISDGENSINEVKISIANVSPDDGTFDIYVRDFYDTDANPVILESYRGVNMQPGNSKYIGLKIGTVDGAYPIKSKYIIAEIADNPLIENCVPCGFLGYPVRSYEDVDIEAPTITYNTVYDTTIRDRKQYFGMSDITGVDIDVLKYKGRNADNGEYWNGYTDSFHLDSTLSFIQEDGSGLTIYVDGEEATSAITWTTVGVEQVTEENKMPIISTESEMEDTIYKDKNLRKFTAYFYGGFDGWDAYRGKRTNTDEYKANRYRGFIKNGYNTNFSTLVDAESLNLPSNAISSDYYAYLCGVNQFENPEMFLINLFATPGIDYVNNQLLVEDVFDMLEEKRGDAFYVVTTPDKPAGASDSVDDMYSSTDVVENLEDTMIDSYYGATYYPWIKYFDSDNQVYINLPATKDVLRNMANVDNKLYPWYAPAGTERGIVDCHSMHKFTRLEDEDNVYNGRINPLKKFSKEGVIVWGNKTMYTGDTPMNRINVVRLMLYLRKLINESQRHLIFEPNDTSLKSQFEDEIKPILSDIKKNRGFTDYYLEVSQTPEQMDEHELSAKLAVKPTPTLEYIEIEFYVTPQGVSFSDI